MPGSPTSSRVAARREPAELASHWAAAGRKADALLASVEAAREAQSGLRPCRGARASRARARAVGRRAGRDRSSCGSTSPSSPSWAAELASQTGAAPRAVELARRAIELVETGDAVRSARLHGRLGRYLHESGRTEAALRAFERAVELVPAEPPSAERAQALAALGEGLMLAWRFASRCRSSEQALALARAVGAREVELRALRDVGRDLAYVGRSGEGLECLSRVLELSEETGHVEDLLQAYGAFTDVLMMAGTAARVGGGGRARARGAPAVRDRQHRARREHHRGAARDRRVGRGRQRERGGDRGPSRRTSRTCSSCSAPTWSSDVGSFEAARTHLEAALGTLREDRGQGIFDIFLAELALWERRWIGADQAVSHALAGRARARPHSSTSGSAPRDCARRPSWQRSRVPAAMPTPSERGSMRQTTSSTLPGVPRRRRRP